MGRGGFTPRGRGGGGRGGRGGGRGQCSFLLRPFHRPVLPELTVLSRWRSRRIRKIARRTRRSWWRPRRWPRSRRRTRWWPWRCQRWSQGHCRATQTRRCLHCQGQRRRPCHQEFGSRRYCLRREENRGKFVNVKS